MATNWCTNGANTHTYTHTWCNIILAYNFIEAKLVCANSLGEWSTYGKKYEPIIMPRIFVTIDNYFNGFCKFVSKCIKLIEQLK